MSHMSRGFRVRILKNATKNHVTGTRNTRLSHLIFFLPYHEPHMYFLCPIGHIQERKQISDTLPLINISLLR